MPRTRPPYPPAFREEAVRPRGREILFIRESGSRSLSAAQWARDRGLSAASVAGGTSIWRMHGLPVERGL